MTEGGRSAVAPDQTEAWRQGALGALLTAEAVAFPAVTLVWLAVRGARSLDNLGVAALLVVMSVAPPLLRRAREAPYRLRALGAVFIPFAVCATLLVSEGPLPSIALGLSMTVVMAAILFGRGTALALVALVVLLTVVIAALVAAGVLQFHVEAVGLYRPRKWLQLAATFALLLGTLVSFVSYVVDHIGRQYHELHEAYDQLGQLHRRLEAGKEEERRDLARELHDELGQGLLVLKLWMAKSDRAAAQGEPAAQAAAVVDDLIGRVRRLSLNLRPPLLDDFGVERALETFLEAQAAASGLQARLKMVGMDAGRLPPEIEIVVFRVVQEAVTNVVRHAQARSVTIDVCRDSRGLTVSVRDDGRGLVIETAQRAAASGRHLGLVGIRERLRGYRGHLEIHAPRGGGTELTAHLPLAAAT
jgi:signal transduction histidine kinase